MGPSFARLYTLPNGIGIAQCEHGNFMAKGDTLGKNLNISDQNKKDY
jgi:hypothetical protein